MRYRARVYAKPSTVSDFWFTYAIESWAWYRPFRWRVEHKPGLTFKHREDAASEAEADLAGYLDSGVEV